jgi:predicted permease
LVVLNALQSVFSIVLMISLGYVLTAKKWFNEDTTKLFSKLVVNISLPTLMISNLMTTYDKEKLSHSLIGLTIPFLSMGICYIIGLGLSKVVKINASRRGAFLSMFFVSNTIFIGLPVNLSLFGDKSVPYVLLYYIANTTFFWTIGVYGISCDGGEVSEKVFSAATLKRILSPPLLSFILAIILILLNITLPLFIMDTCKYLGNLTTPLSMLFIGITIYSIDIKDIKPDAEMFLILIGRFIISPLSVFILSIFIPIPLLMKKVFIIQAAMPVMTQTAIISKAYGSDHKYVAVMITVTTVACLIFIPLYMYLFTL